MRVKTFFYAGRTQIENGEGVSFDGIWKAKENELAVDVYHAIRNSAAKQHGKKVVLSSFNLIDIKLEEEKT
ncbi:MAG TPA: hypothetical protein ENH82_04210 [bacterium]|nr:hypothetical protein [bacterium]